MVAIRQVAVSTRVDIEFESQGGANQIKSTVMKKNNLYYATWVIVSAIMSILALWSVYNSILPVFMFFLLIISSLGSLAISCYEWEQHIKKEVDNG
jgi:4-hydroxybenzoate polyprenyltransferase